MSSVIPQVQIERQFDAVALNATLNHPAVRPWVGGSATGALDLTPLVADGRNALLVGEHGSMLFLPLCAGIWEMHTQVRPEGRGAWTLGLARSALGWLFTHTDAAEILTRVPKGNLPARAGAQRVGFRLAWMQPAGWELGARRVDCGIWSLPLQAWLAGEFAAALEAAGRAFAEHFAPGVPRPAGQDRALGFALSAIRGGHPEKGCAFLNRWAAIAQWSPSFVAAREPLVVSLGGARFEFNAEGVPIRLLTSH